MGKRRIALSGTHCTGKTTLLEALPEELPQYTFIEGPTRTLKDQGYPINNDQSGNYDSTQLMCLHIDIENLKRTESYIIQDRCLLDTYIYTQYLFNHGKVTEPVLKAVKSAWDALKFHYTAIFYPDPNDITLVGDKYRNSDIEFRDEIDQLFKSCIKPTKPGIPMYFISGTNSERIERIKNILKIK